MTRQASATKWVAELPAEAGLLDPGEIEFVLAGRSRWLQGAVPDLADALSASALNL